MGPISAPCGHAREVFAVPAITIAIIADTIMVTVLNDIAVVTIIIVVNAIAVVTITIIAIVVNANAGITSVNACQCPSLVFCSIPLRLAPLPGIAESSSMPGLLSKWPMFDRACSTQVPLADSHSLKTTTPAQT